MKQYKIIKTPFGGEMLKRTDENGQEWFIPIDPANSDYQAYLVTQSTPIDTEDE